MRYAHYIDIFEDVVQVCGDAEDQDNLAAEFATPAGATGEEIARRVRALGGAADLPWTDHR